MPQHGLSNLYIPNSSLAMNDGATSNLLGVPVHSVAPRIRPISPISPHTLGSSSGSVSSYSSASITSLASSTVTFNEELISDDRISQLVAHMRSVTCGLQLKEKKTVLNRYFIFEGYQAVEWLLQNEAVLCNFEKKHAIRWIVQLIDRGHLLRVKSSGVVADLDYGDRKQYCFSSERQIDAMLKRDVMLQNYLENLGQTANRMQTTYNSLVQLQDPVKTNETELALKETVFNSLMRLRYPSYPQQVTSNSKTLEVKDRKHILKTYKKCFIANELIDCLCTDLLISRQEACKIAQDMQDNDLIRHVSDHSKRFNDTAGYFQFCEKWIPESSNFRRE